MATSGTYTFNPSLGEIVLYAYNLCEVRNTALAQEHMEAARMSTNLLLANWANRGVNLWAVDLVTVNFNQTPAILTVTGNGTSATLTYATPNTPVYTIGTQITVAGTGVVDGLQTVTASSNGSVTFAASYNGSTSGGTISTSTPAATYSIDPNTVVMLDAYVENRNDKGKRAWLSVAEKGVVYGGGAEVRKAVISFKKNFKFFFLDTIADGGK
jgi:hypothetical protein